MQNIQDFNCSAFTPSLKLVKSSLQKAAKLSTDSIDNFPPKSLQQILDSDNLKYQRALAAQKLGNDPDVISMDIKYHFAWNVTHRKTFFSNPTESFELVSKIFLNCSEVVDSFVRLMWLAPDHVHIYVESDGDKSVDTLAQELKKISASSIAVKDLGLMTRSDASFNLWDKAYFVETLG
ncbi:MAG: transposase [Thermodesulfobacteriota bacterium]